MKICDNFGGPCVITMNAKLPEAAQCDHVFISCKPAYHTPLLIYTRLTQTECSGYRSGLLRTTRIHATMFTAKDILIETLRDKLNKYILT